MVYYESVQDLEDQIEAAAAKLKDKHGYSVVSIVIGDETNRKVTYIQPEHANFVLGALEQALVDIKRSMSDHLPFGSDGVRDPDFPCEEFVNGKPEGGNCMSGGHYLCDE